ncbi:hypothetical protein EGR_11216 [Echinococcus granulosus]|uniref:Uncharacterized protein n=1 Tax=Echinococcus granulosus TaxID=6210 RepID=W6U6E5_ECHGR|nr:hypothetical protein EGR_11216 [Echinococcus granulosus]EUB53927.1 hypothetical protein EGR_11216 [Echinococcus granulosus]
MNMNSEGTEVKNLPSSTDGGGGGETITMGRLDVKHFLLANYILHKIKIISFIVYICKYNFAACICSNKQVMRNFYIPRYVTVKQAGYRKNEILSPIKRARVHTTSSAL